MATTTAYAIRALIATKIRECSPALATGVKFVEHLYEQPFREWADANPMACLRRFSVLELGVSEPPTVSNGDIEWHSVDFEILVSYPYKHALYGRGGEVDLMRVMESDQDIIETAIGLRGTIADATFIRDGSSTVREYSDGLAYTFIRQRMGHYRGYT